MVNWTGFKDVRLAEKILPEIRDIGFDIGRLCKIEFDSPEGKAEEAAWLAERRVWQAAAYNALPLPGRSRLSGGGSPGTRQTLRPTIGAPNISSPLSPG
jgi:hypothetical protein